VEVEQTMRILTSVILCLVGLATTDRALGQEEPSVQAKLNPIIVRVNQDPVHAIEITLAIRTIENQLRSRGRLESVSGEEIVEVATQQVIEQKLLAQEARRFGLKPDESRVTGMMQLAARQTGGEESLAKTMALGGSSLEQLEGVYRERDLGRVFISKQIRPTIQVTDAEVAEFYNNHTDVFTTEEQVHARHIVIEVAQGADGESERRAYERALKARARAIGGEDFAQLAQEFSEGTDAESGGDLGFFTRRTTLEEIAEAAFALEPGQVSGAIRSRFGYHVIKVEERLPAQQKSFDEVRDHAQTLLVNERTADVVAELLKTLHDAATVEYVQQSGSTEGDS
jgi:parvulin-like peptidyl-prolyl isomerase